MAMVRFNKSSALCSILVAYVAVCTNCGWVSEHMNVTQHDKATLSCYSTYSAKPDLAMRAIGNEENTLIYADGKLQPSFEGTGKYRVDADSGFYNLSIFNVTLDDAGEYECQEDAGGGLNHILYLLVDDADECYLKKDGCSQYAACTNTHGSYSCHCLPGFTGDGFRCDDLNECDNSTTCDVNAFCNNTIGSSICTCNQGYIELQAVGGCTELTNVNACVGERVVLLCQSAKWVVWMFVASSDAAVNGTYLYRNGRVNAERVGLSEEYLNPHDHNYTIVLRNVQFNESGYYVCFEKETNTNRGYHLNVTGVGVGSSATESRVWMVVVGVVAGVVVVMEVVVVGVIVNKKRTRNTQSNGSVNQEENSAKEKFPLQDQGLPLELSVIVMVKVVVLVSKCLMEEGRPSAGSLAIREISMVCQSWLRLLLNTSVIRRQLKAMLEKMRALQAWRENVVAVASLDNQLFVISCCSSTVSVHDVTSFKNQEDIELEGKLQNPSDIATCEGTRSVYIAEHESRCVWRIDRSSSSASRLNPSVADDKRSSPAEKFINCDRENYSPLTLSTTGRQLLVTSHNRLRIYAADGKLLRSVKLLPKDISLNINWTIQHAVQATAGGNIFVCRLGTLGYEDYAEIAEFGSDGKMERCYYSGRRKPELNRPIYMALIEDGRLLVADDLAERVLVFNSKLMPDGTLLEHELKNSGGPVRLCYHSPTGLLFVVLSHTNYLSQWRI